MDGTLRSSTPQESITSLVSVLPGGIRVMLTLASTRSNPAVLRNYHQGSEQAGARLCSSGWAASSSATKVRVRLEGFSILSSPRSWTSFRGNPIFGIDRIDINNTQALLGFAALCIVSEGNQLCTIASILFQPNRIEHKVAETFAAG